jgi:oxygen-independent coproporphyrinogen III oxidase
MSEIAARPIPPVALFVFVPFCRIKCTYCDFNAYANLGRVMEPYASAVAREISAGHYAERWQVPDTGTTQNDELADRTAVVRLPAKSIYLGGGTPSLLPTPLIEKIVQSLHESFLVAPDVEVTLEANPGTVDLAKLRSLRSMGINRLSLGVQSFDDATVRRLNRGHTVGEAFEAFDLARRAGFENQSLDFIYGLPLQTMEEWRSTLAQALALGAEHLSLYALKVEEGTGLKHQIAHGKYPEPDDDLAADMYGLAEEMLDAAGYEHYEISNWARKAPGQQASRYRSEHNLTYWHNEPYLGFGAGAHSYFGNVRYWDILSPVEYIRRIELGSSVVDEHEEIGRELEMAETMFLGLRLDEGVSFERFRTRFGIDPREQFGVQIGQVEKLGLAEMTDEAVRLTRRGRLLSNEVFWRFLPD